ncbi:hypothetical protein [Mycobacterium terramassiliense]|uniref:Uncharacterized protein n=1 Tax=Mycobacterium terramassiliense TaxID=1841859 RepID=A0A2U3NJ67_9MYCO|nr:hypothetical protein [Mycobacterium terramassiliense]SPM31577.1 hypothetical protein MTAB308_5096 [Mycobacterium terramassiliense]
MAFTAADVAAFLGKPGDAATEAYATTALAVIGSMAQSYTRGQGFTNGAPADDIAAAIFTATLRFMANKDQLEKSKTKGPFSVDIRGSFSGWNLAETFVLNRYRKMATS